MLTEQCDTQFWCICSVIHRLKFMYRGETRGCEIMKLAVTVIATHSTLSQREVAACGVALLKHLGELLLGWFLSMSSTFT